jgi:hypothetical protein
MGLIVELDNCENEDYQMTVEERLADLLPHFYPPSHHSPHTSNMKLLLALPQDSGVDSKDNPDYDLLGEARWEEDPGNFKNCPSALAKFDALLDSISTGTVIVDRRVVSRLVPCALQVAGCQVSTLQQTGLELVQKIYSNKLLLHGHLASMNAHHVVNECALVTITNDNVALIRAGFDTMALVVETLTDTKDRITILDKLTERSLFCLMHSRDDKRQRLEHWRGLKLISTLMGVAIVRHFFWLFKVISVLSAGADEAESEAVSSLVDTLESDPRVKERVVRRQQQHYPLAAKAAP